MLLDLDSVDAMTRQRDVNVVVQATGDGEDDGGGGGDGEMSDAVIGKLEPPMQQQPLQTVGKANTG